MPHPNSEKGGPGRHARRHVLASLLAGLALPAALRPALGGEADTAGRIVGAFDGLFAGPHEGQRAVHAKGLLCEGTFTPTEAAARISRAAHFAGPGIPVLVRFSNFAAVPGLPDGHPAASPRGMAIRFLLPDGAETDIVAHSYNGFPAATPEAFLRFLRSLPDAGALAALAAAEPAVRDFLAHPKPAPASYASENFFGVTAFVFVDAEGRRRAGRYRIQPLDGAAWLTATEATAREADYLTAEMRTRLAAGPAGFRLLLQIAAPGDGTDDGSRPWPEDRPCIELGTLSLQRLAAHPDRERTDLRFVPTSLVAGIEPSEDPMLLARTLSYDISAERRARP
jgi:catalase